MLFCICPQHAILSPLVEYRARVGSVSPNSPSVEDVREQVLSKEMPAVAATRWATERLLAWRMDEARTVMRVVLSDQQEHAADPDQRMQQLNVMLSAWEYETAFKHGNMGMGMVLHCLHNADRKTVGMEEEQLSPKLLLRCGDVCWANAKWRHAIDAYTHGGQKKRLQQMAEWLRVFQGPKHAHLRHYAELADERAELLS